MKNVIIKRLEDNGRQTIGFLTAFEGMKKIFECYTLELTYLGNQNNVSCIPYGTYLCVPRTSDKYGEHYHITNVPGRELILFHSANFYRELRGCIGVGQDLYDIDSDGNVDITSSRVTMNAFKSAMGKENFTVQII